MLPVHLLLERIYDETGYYNYVSAMPSGDIRRKNLDMLSMRAESYGRTGMYGLYNFTRYVEALLESNYDEGTADEDSENADKVRIMTVHGSKGLEYPIVFLARSAAPERARDDNDNIVTDSELGIASDYTDTETKLRYPSLKKAAIRLKNREEDIGEKLRLLYVAMTRAKEKLIVTGTMKASRDNSCAERIEHKAAEGALLSDMCGSNGKLPKLCIAGCGSYLDLMLMAAGADGQAFDISIYDRTDIIGYAKNELEEEMSLYGRIDAVNSGFDESTVSDYAASLKRIFEAEYAYAEETKLKPKLSVSEIKAAEDPKADAYDYDDITAELNVQEEDSTAEALRIYPAAYKSPAGDEESDRKNAAAAEAEPDISADNILSGKVHAGGAGRGTAFHRAMELIDPSLSAEENLQYLAECGKMTAKELKLLDRSAVRDFLESELASRMAEAYADGRLRREQHFMAGIPARELISSQDSDELQLLQGIIDAYIYERDESITLIDYKTDRVSDEDELRSHYRVQLELYARALEQLTGCAVRDKIIYSTFMKRQIML